MFFSANLEPLRIAVVSQDLNISSFEIILKWVLYGV